MRPVALSLAVPVALLVAGPVRGLDYERDVMPIFVEKCADCHGGSGKVKGGLRLDDPGHFRKRFAKNSLVTPGDWDASYLFITLFRPAGHDDAMPPEGEGERLTPAEVALVQRWIAEGAEIDGVRGETGPLPEPGEPGYIAVEDAPDDEESMPLTPARPRTWTNREGREITATFVRVEGDVALLRMANGRVYRVPVDTLSDESRAALEE